MDAKKAGFQFEHEVAEKLKGQGFTGIEVTKASADYGADIIAFKDDLKYVFQCKKYKGTVGFSALKDVSTAMEIYSADNGVLVCDTVFSKNVYKALKEIDKPIELVGLEELKEWKPKIIKEKPYKPFHYQKKVLIDLIKHRKQGNNSALVVMATGLGKTLVAGWDLQNQLKKGQKALFLVHRKDILVDNAKEFHRILNLPKRKFDIGTYFLGKKFDEKTDVVFSTFQTMKKYYKKVKQEYFDYIIIDEAHHSPAISYAKIIEYFKPKFILGITATPKRITKNDNEFIKKVFGEPIVDLDLAEALTKEPPYLSPVKYSVFCDNIDYEKLKTVNKKLSMEQLNKSYFIPTKEEDVEKIVYEEMKKIDNPKTIIFCPKIKYIQSVKEQGLYADAEIYHSNMDSFKREEIFRNFKKGKTRTILVVDLFNEGINIPDANLLVFLRTTYSPTIFFQQLGRGLRKKPDKKYVRVLDFVGTLERIKKTINIFGHLLIIKDFVQKIEKAKQFSNVYQGKKIKDTGLLEPFELDFYQAGKKVAHKETKFKNKDFLKEMKFLKKHLIKSGPWTEEEILDALRPICENLGYYPSQTYLMKNGRTDLSVQVGRNGGVYYFAKKLGYLISHYGQRGYYDKFGNVEKDLNKIEEEIGHSPSYGELKTMRKFFLLKGIKKHGGINKVKKIMGKPLLRKTWKKEEALKKYKLVCESSGGYTKIRDLKDKQLSSLASYINRNGGIKYFAKQTGFSPTVKKKKYFPVKKSKDEILLETKNYAKNNIMPTSKELREARRSDLDSLISKSEGYPAVAQKIGLVYDRRIGTRGIKHKEANYWKKWNNIEKAFEEARNKINGELTAKKLSENGFAYLVGACYKHHRGLAKVKEKLGYN